MGKILSVPFLETITFSYLLTELQLFGGDQEEIPWSQKRGHSPCGWVNMWHSVGKWNVKGNCWGFWARWFFLIRESHVEKYFQTWKWILGECDAGHGHSFLRLWEQWGGQSITDMLNWSAALILLIDWINSSNCFIQTGCYMRKKILLFRYSLPGVLVPNWSNKLPVSQCVLIKHWLPFLSAFMLKLLYLCSSFLPLRLIHLGCLDILLLYLWFH